MKNNKDWTDNIKDFLNQQIQENKLSVSQLAKLTDIPGTTMREMLNNRRPEIKNIVKIADHFNCSVDSLLSGNHSDLPTTELLHKKLSLKELNANLKKFVQDKLKEDNINQYNLGKTIGHSDDVVRRFLRNDGNDEKMLSTDVVVTLANHYNTSIDEMLGRSSDSSKQQELTKESPKKISEKLLLEVKSIGRSIAGSITLETRSVKSYSSKSFAESVTKKPSPKNPTRGM
ncbi:MAG: helix-turn-helix transcriptional regulator [Rickettsia endosymbiont of Bryobia graminum]|nr:helix-turn-helix transcriptional regulator [Rickettsia endosymbiont of Bryobia graminum]